MPAPSRATWPAQSAPTGPRHPRPFPLTLNVCPSLVHQPANRRISTNCAYRLKRSPARIHTPFRSQRLIFTPSTLKCCISNSHRQQHASGGHVAHSHIQHGARRTVSEVMAVFWDLHWAHFNAYKTVSHCYTA